MYQTCPPKLYLIAAGGTTYVITHTSDAGAREELAGFLAVEAGISRSTPPIGAAPAWALIVQAANSFTPGQHCLHVLGPDEEAALEFKPLACLVALHRVRLQHLGDVRES